MQIQKAATFISCQKWKTMLNIEIILWVSYDGEHFGIIPVFSQALKECNRDRSMSYGNCMQIILNDAVKLLENGPWSIIKQPEEWWIHRCDLYPKWTFVLLPWCKSWLLMDTPELYQSCLISKQLFIEKMLEKYPHFLLWLYKYLIDSFNYEWN